MSYKTKGEMLAAQCAGSVLPAVEIIYTHISTGIRAAHVAPVFTRGFDAGYVAFGDSIETHHNGYRIAARIEHDSDHGIDDDDTHNIDQDVTGCNAEQQAALLEARAAFFRDEWHYCGVVLSVTRDGVMLAEHAASLWGIECNYPGSDNRYLTLVAQELLPEALTVAEAAFDSLVASSGARAAQARQGALDAVRDSAALESMIDAHGLAAVVEMLRDICDEKAAHIETSHGDSLLAKDWARAGHYFARAARTQAVQDVTP